LEKTSGVTHRLRAATLASSNEEGWTVELTFLRVMGAGSNRAKASPDEAQPSLPTGLTGSTGQLISRLFSQLLSCLSGISARIMTNALAAWRSPRPAFQPPLVLAGRLALAPRQTVALIEAGEQKFLVACSADGTLRIHSMAGALPEREFGREFGRDFGRHWELESRLGREGAPGSRRLGVRRGMRRIPRAASSVFGHPSSDRRRDRVS
jgi:hypothetical protein